MANWIGPHLTVAEAQGELRRYPAVERQAFAIKLVTFLFSLDGSDLDGRDDDTLRMITAVAVVITETAAQLVRTPQAIAMRFDMPGGTPHGQ